MTALGAPKRSLTVTQTLHQKNIATTVIPSIYFARIQFKQRTKGIDELKCVISKGSYCCNWYACREILVYNPLTKVFRHLWFYTQINKILLVLVQHPHNKYPIKFDEFEIYLSFIYMKTEAFFYQLTKWQSKKSRVRQAERNLKFDAIPCDSVHIPQFRTIPEQFDHIDKCY